MGDVVNYILSARYVNFYFRHRARTKLWNYVDLLFFRPLWKASLKLEREQIEIVCVVRFARIRSDAVVATSIIKIIRELKWLPIEVRLMLSDTTLSNVF